MSIALLKSSMSSFLSHEGLLVGVSVLPSTPKPGKPKENHTQDSIRLQTDWPIRSGSLLVLVTYVTPLSLSMLATQLSTFLSLTAYMLPLRWSAQEWQRNLPAFQNSPVLIASPLLPVLFSRLYFLPGQSAFY